MNYTYLADSSCDTNETILNTVEIKKAPLSITLEETVYVDDGTIDLPDFLQKINASREVPRSAAPSPMDFVKCCEKDSEGVFIATLSARLSGSYNSASVAAEMLREQGKKVHVFNSRSAASGETLILMKAKELEEQGHSFEEIVEMTEKYIDEMETVFLLDDISFLMKNGRMSKLAGRLAQLLLIKPILSATPEGEIQLFDKTRSYAKALARLGEIIASTPRKAEELDLIIDHCNCIERAEKLKAYIEERRKFRSVHIVQTGGLSGMYAAQGGLICTF